VYFEHQGAPRQAVKTAFVYLNALAPEGDNQRGTKFIAMALPGCSDS
jgi:hypothetical protein